MSVRARSSSALRINGRLQPGALLICAVQWEENSSGNPPSSLDDRAHRLHPPGAVARDSPRYPPTGGCPLSGTIHTSPIAPAERPQAGGSIRPLGHPRSAHDESMSVRQSRSAAGDHFRPRAARRAREAVRRHRPGPPTWSPCLTTPVAGGPAASCVLIGEDAAEAPRELAECSAGGGVVLGHRLSAGSSSWQRAVAIRADAVVELPSGRRRSCRPARRLCRGRRRPLARWWG